MAIKHTTRRRIFWGILISLCVFVISLVIIPPMITLNVMRPRIEQAIFENTGIAARIDGNVNFSIIGGAMIVAHDVTIPLGKIDAVMFSVPLGTIFNPSRAQLRGDISINGGHIVLSSLAAGRPLAGNLEIHNVLASFLGKEYMIVDATLRGGQLSGVLRTDDHKYNISYSGDTFNVANPNNQLDITGQMYSDGSARGTISVVTPDINKWFEFEYPRIDHTVEFSARFEWNGEYGIKFTDIRADKFSGSIILENDGARDINITGHGIDMDLGFITSFPATIENTRMDIDLYGKIKFGERILRHVLAQVNITNNRADVSRIVADDTTFTGGYITKNGAHNITIQTPFNDKMATCLFSGTPQNWQCAEFSYDGMMGSLSVAPDGFNAVIQSDNLAPDYDTLSQFLSRFSTRGHVIFQFANAAGEFDIDNTPRAPTFSYAQNKTLGEMGYNMAFLPPQMQRASGDFTRRDGVMEFAPYDGTWRIAIDGNKFEIFGNNIKSLAPTLDLRVLRDMEYSATGKYNGGDVSDLVINIAGHTFRGAVSRGRITLHTDMFDIDAFTSQEFRDNWFDMEFVSNSPILIPFDLGIRISLAASRLIYNGDEYANFAYSLKPDMQTFSITDDARGAISVDISRDSNAYDIYATLNRFLINGNLLRGDSTLNLRDTMITGTAQMHTWGNIAHDIEYNMTGTMDLTFDGGQIIGIGIDQFYAAADTIGTLNAEFILTGALDGGHSAIKTMRVIGRYENGNFETTQPFTLGLRHADVTGNLSITDGRISSDMDIVMRGLGPGLVTIDLQIMPNALRQYSLSQIMTSFDPEYMRQFVRTHNRF